MLKDDDEDDDDEKSYQNDIATEVLEVGAGIGGGCKHSSELKVLNYKEAMASKDKQEWQKEIAKEHERMKNIECGKQCLNQKYRKK